jgi:hypothetical protein
LRPSSGEIRPLPRAARVDPGKGAARPTSLRDGVPAAARRRSAPASGQKPRRRIGRRRLSLFVPSSILQVAVVRQSKTSCPVSQPLGQRVLWRDWKSASPPHRSAGSRFQWGHGAAWR